MVVSSAGDWYVAQNYHPAVDDATALSPSYAQYVCESLNWIVAGYLINRD